MLAVTIIINGILTGAGNFEEAREQLQYIVNVQRNSLGNLIKYICRVGRVIANV